MTSHTTAHQTEIGRAIGHGLVADLFGASVAIPLALRVGLPIRAESVDADAVLAAIARDKKSRDGRVPFVLAPRIGAFRLVYDVADDDVRRVLAELGPTRGESAIDDKHPRYA